MYVSEAKVLPWIVEEAARYVEPRDDARRESAIDRERERAALTAERGRVVEMRRDNLIGRDEVRRMVRAIDDRLVALDPPLSRPDLARLDWTHWSDAEINETLRSLFASIELDDWYRPLRAEWRDASWRGAA